MISECINIVAKYIDIRGNEVIINSSNIEDITESLYYNEIVFLNLSDCKLKELPILPTNLQILNCQNNIIEKLPQIPKTIRMIYARKNKIEIFPDVEHCLDLENIDLYDNNIYCIDSVIPVNVRAIDISFNKLRSINYNKILNTNTKITASFNFLTEIPPNEFRSGMIYDHNEIKYTPNRKLDIPIPGPNLFINDTPPQLDGYETNTNRYHNLIEPVKIDINTVVYTNNQNVHNSSIQNSVNRSVNYIINYTSKNRIGYNNNDFIENIKSIFVNNIRRKNKLFYLIPKHFLLGFIVPIESWCNETTIHSSHGITYKTLLKKVWEIIQDHEYRTELEMILCEELNDSKGLCFTGRFTRTINSLNGFIEQVSVGISDKEQMQNQIAAIINKCRKEIKNKDEFLKITKEKVNNILDEHNISSIERDAWIDAIDY